MICIRQIHTLRWKIICFLALSQNEHELFILLCSLSRQICLLHHHPTACRWVVEEIKRSRERDIEFQEKNKTVSSFAGCFFPNMNTYNIHILAQFTLSSNQQFVVSFVSPLTLYNCCYYLREQRISYLIEMNAFGKLKNLLVFIQLENGVRAPEERVYL